MQRAIFAFCPTEKQSGRIKASNISQQQQHDILTHRLQGFTQLNSIVCLCKLTIINHNNHNLKAALHNNFSYTNMQTPCT